jgi:hypothetical protein
LCSPFEASQMASVIVMKREMAELRLLDAGGSESRGRRAGLENKRGWITGKGSSREAVTCGRAIYQAKIATRMINGI